VVGVANFTLTFEVENLGIYQGILPNWNLQGPYTFVSFLGLGLALWVAFNGAKAFVRVRAGKHGKGAGDPRYGPGYGTALWSGLKQSPLARLVVGAVRRPMKGRARPAPLRPEAVRGKATQRRAPNRPQDR
jgi:hypothetical protein